MRTSGVSRLVRWGPKKLSGTLGLKIKVGGPNFFGSLGLKFLRTGGGGGDKPLLDTPLRTQHNDLDRSRKQGTIRSVGHYPFHVFIYVGFDI